MQSIIKLQKIATHVSLGLNPFKVHTFTSNSWVRATWVRDSKVCISVKGYWIGKY